MYKYEWEQDRRNFCIPDVPSGSSDRPESPGQSEDYQGTDGWVAEDFYIEL